MAIMLWYIILVLYFHSYTSYMIIIELLLLCKVILIHNMVYGNT